MLVPSTVGLGTQAMVCYIGARADGLAFGGHAWGRPTCLGGPRAPPTYPSDAPPPRGPLPNASAAPAPTSVTANATTNAPTSGLKTLEMKNERPNHERPKLGASIERFYFHAAGLVTRAPFNKEVEKRNKCHDES